MEIYWIGLILSVGIAICIMSKNIKVFGKRGKITRTRIFISLFPLLLIAILRWNVGVDVVYGSGYYYLEYMAISIGKGNVLGYEIGSVPKFV